MSTEKRILLASVLSIAVMAGYMAIVGRSSAARPPQGPTTASSPLLDPVTPPSQAADEAEETVTLESDHLRVMVGAQSAAIKEVALKSFKKLQSAEVLSFGDKYTVTALSLPYGTGWKLTDSTQLSARWEQRDGEQVRQLSLQLDPKQPVYRISLVLDGGAEQSSVQMRAAWGPESGSANSNVVEAVVKTPKKHLKYRQGSAKTVSQDIQMVTLTEQFFCQSLDLSGLPGHETVALSRSNAAPLIATINIPLQQPGTYTIPVYIGPRDYFWMERAGFAESFHIGILEKIGLMLMLFLKWIASVTHNYGVAIIGLSVFVTIMLAPFTLMSFRSMKKMQELQPKIDQLRKKHESDPKRVNEEIFALFKENRVSPLSGCLPILLQMPIFIALWSAISHVVEVRGQSFLWIKDLSMPDRLFALPMGLDFNLLPILMAGAMYFQTKLSSGNVQTQGGAANPMAGPMMPILFGLMFYNVQAALVLYWLSNSIVSILIYRAGRV